MKTRETLKNIIEKKNFKTFWHCYEFLTTASYSPMEAFSACIEQFGADKMFDNVAFFRRNEDMWVAHSVYSNPQATPKINIGIINDENKHLTEFYKIYHKRYSEGEVSVQRDIEDTCEMVRVYDITPFIMDFVMEKMFKHYGIDGNKKLERRIKDMPQQVIARPNNINDTFRRLDDNVRRLDELIMPHRPYEPPAPRQDNIRYLNPDNNGDNNRA
jgi:hypothetical protein